MEVVEVLKVVLVLKNTELAAIYDDAVRNVENYNTVPVENLDGTTSYVKNPYTQEQITKEYIRLGIERGYSPGELQDQIKEAELDKELQSEMQRRKINEDMKNGNLPGYNKYGFLNFLQY